MTWQLSRDKSPTENQIDRWAGLMWTIETAQAATFLKPSTNYYYSLTEKHLTYLQKTADLAAVTTATADYPKETTLAVLRNLAGCSPDFNKKNIPNTVHARRAERLVLALDRLTLALPDAKAAEPLRAPLKKLFADVQSLPDFAPATFADHLAEFQKALPAAP